jgi:hypothetical protein
LNTIQLNVGGDEKKFLTLRFSKNKIFTLSPPPSSSSFVSFKLVS